jgi:hypothetical protein
LCPLPSTPSGAPSVYWAIPSSDGMLSALSAGGPKTFSLPPSSSILNSRRAVLRMISLIWLKLASSLPGTSTMMSSSRVVTAASRRPSSSTRRLTVSFACATARSRICDSTSPRILNVTSFGWGPGVCPSSLVNSFVKRSSIFDLSAGSLKPRRMMAASGCETWTFSSSLDSSSRVTRPSPEWKPKAMASCCRMSSA